MLIINPYKYASAPGIRPYAIWNSGTNIDTTTSAATGGCFRDSTFGSWDRGTRTALTFPDGANAPGIEFTVDAGLNQGYRFGFGSGGFVASEADQEFGIRISSSNTSYQAMEGSSTVYNSFNTGLTWSVGDVFKVFVDGGAGAPVVKYAKNGVVFFTSSKSITSLFPIHGHFIANTSFAGAVVCRFGTV
jgi:hypothetical protein